jgi:pyruvate formate lyase activating enzyme
VFERLLPFLDNILFDVKHVDNVAHQSFTGFSNHLILSNLRRLAELGASITIRVPLIPGFNATPAGIQTIARFVLSLNSTVNTIDLLPYHTLSRTKYKALGREYPWKDHNRLTETEIEALIRIIEAQGLVGNVGG